MVSIALPVEVDVTAFDFSSVSAYLESREIHFWTGEGAQHRTDTIPLQLPQTDTRANRDEIPSALGRFFAQGDFSHGANQLHFHYESSDHAKFLYSEGIDISEVGLIKNLKAMAENTSLSPVFSGGSGKTCQAGGYTFVCDGNSILRFSDITGAATTLNPHDGEGAVAVRDICTEGTRIFAALGANGIHVSSDNGATWSHYSDAAAILIGFLKDRVIATTARILYEITASGAAPSPTTTLKEGWTFTDLDETGEFVYASAVYESGDKGGQSRVYHYGLDDSLAFIEQGSSVLPDGHLCYSLKGYLGLMLLGCGKTTEDDGKDALLYKAVPSDTGYLPVQLVADSKGAGALDLSVKTISTSGRNFLFGWSLGEDSPFGSREGMGIYDPALDSFAHHHYAYLDEASPDPLLSIETVGGMHVFVTTNGIFYEDMETYVDGYVISSLATFGNPGLKNWDESQVATKGLPNTASVELQYSTLTPEEGVWVSAGVHSTPDATLDTFRHATVESERLAVKLISNATSDGSAAPEIESFSVRVNPTLANTEYQLLRTIHLVGEYGQGKRGGMRHANPRTERNALRTAMFDWFDWHEADASYNVRLFQMSEIKTVTNYATTNGDPRKEEYVVVVDLRGREI